LWQGHKRQRRDRTAQGLDLRDEFGTNPVDRYCGAAGVAGLGGVIRRTQRKRVESSRRAALGQRAEHYDRELGIQLAQGRQRLQPVHHWHFDVECDQIRLELRNPRQTDSAVAGRSNHFERAVSRQGVREQFANYYRIIHYQDANCSHNKSRLRVSKGRVLPIGLLHKSSVESLVFIFQKVQKQ
jgi:hypothetical protein